MENSLKGHEVKAPMITLDNTQLRAHVSDMVRQSVEDTLNALLDAEADRLCNAQKYERNDERISTNQGRSLCSGFPDDCGNRTAQDAEAAADTI